MPKVDLHTHSTFSDGLLTLPQLVALAQKHGIKLLGLADHDTFAGAQEFTRLCLEHGITPLPGVEIGTHFAGRDFHLLVFKPRRRLYLFQNFLKKQQHKRRKKALEIISDFETAGIFFSPADKRKLLAQPSVGKPQIGSAILRHKGNRRLLQKKYNFPYYGDKKLFFKFFLEKPGQLGYITRAKTDTLKAIKMAKQTGALSVLAHPDLDLPDRQTAQKIIETFKKRGLWGVELPHIRVRERVFYRRLAKRLGLRLTYGSDIHDNPRHLGIKISQTEYNQLLKHL